MKKTLLTIALTLFTLVGFAQTDIDRKLSITTQMFLDELNGEIQFNPDTKSTPSRGKTIKDERTLLPERIYAHPDTIDGKVYISCFVTLDDNSNTSALEALGVIVQCKFNEGITTCLIPVDKIEEVAAISQVTQVEVSPLMRPFTNAAREKTNVDDVISFSNDARAAGLSKGYDGTGVLLGVIDTGIDFQHIAFKDKNGNSRIKRAYVYNGSSAQEYSSITSNSPTTDDSSENHGTHTSTTAGGSSVIISGNNVTVTDNHANATYGGMAPGADLYLAGVYDLSSTYLANAFQKICEYADNNNQPVVVSNSWGSQRGPHDGTGTFPNIMKQYFGDTHPNHICLFAASNDAGGANPDEGGGFHICGTATESNPLGTIVRYYYYSDTDCGYIYSGVIANAWSRSAKNIACKVHVLDDKDGSVLATKTVTNAGTIDVSKYYSGTLRAYFNTSSATGKREIYLSASSLTTKSHTDYDSDYTLAVEFYPTDGSTEIDVWADGYAYFTNYLTTSGHTWTKGSDDMSVSDDATDPNVIAIGAYVSKNNVVDYNNNNYNLSYYTMDDIAYFSSYATADQSPTGLAYPWISAPGATVVAGVNHYDTNGTFSYINGNSTTYGMYRVNSNTTYPYGSMEGTSMATPVAAGIVALWMQAAKEVGKDMTVNDIKEVMRETAINDYYTTSGPNASHFGNGKIDALAGIKYILGVASEPTIKATPTSLSFEGYATMAYTKTVNVKGVKLDDNITATLTDANQVYAIDKSNITVAEATNGVDITVTWSPLTAGQTTATLTLSSAGAESVIVNLTGVAEAATPTIMADVAELTFNGNINETYSKTIHVTGRFLNEDVTVTLNDNSHVFSVSPATIAATAVDEGADITVSFNAATENSFTGSITLTSEGAEPVTITLNAMASDGGTASDSYLNIAKYATIDEAGWRTTFVNNLYKYTEYKDENVAWLTLPVFGGFVGAKYATNSSTFGSGNPQKWITTNITSNNNTYAGKTWSYTPSVTNPYQGSGAYFKSTSAKVTGYNYRSNTTKLAVTFFVTNATAVKVLGIGAKGASDSYPAAVKVYECTKNADGTVTASNTVSKFASSSSTDTNRTFTLDIDDLEANKIYKVEASVYRGYLYEIAFKTPLTVTPPVRKGDINRDGKVDIYDVTALIDIILNDDTEEPYTFTQYDHVAADVNEDSKIDIYDVTMLIDIILNED